MAKHIYTKDERREQGIKSGLKLARKHGISKLTMVAVANDIGASSPLMFHVFGTKAELVKAVRAESKRKGISLDERKVGRSTISGKFVNKATVAAKPATTITQTVKRKRSIAEVKAIKDKVAGKRPVGVSRSAGSGKFVSRAEVVADPDGTVTHGK